MAGAVAEFVQDNAAIGVTKVSKDLGDNCLVGYISRYFKAVAEVVE